MTTRRSFPTQRLKHVVGLHRTRAADDIDVPYVGLENIESWTGRLTATPDTQAPSEDAADGTVGQSQSNGFQSGDILFGKLRPYLAKAWVADFSGRCTTEALVLRAERIEPRFLLYVLLQPSFISAVDSSTYGSKMPRAEWDFIGSVPIPVPPQATQRAIVDFLDAEVSELDALVAAKQRLLDLLAEKRKAIIATAATRGFDPKVKLRDSGVPWLGEIPAHWGIVQSRRLFRVRNEPARPSDRQLTASQKYGMLPQSEFVELEGRRVVELEKGIGSLRHVEPNDFVISLRSFQGGFEWSKLSGSVTFHYVVLVPIKWVHPPFFAHLFKSLPFIEALRSTATLIRDGQDLRFSHFTLIDLPIVPLEEQRLIAARLDREIAKLDAVRVATERTIALLKERRSALIAAAVSGQLDLGTAA